MLERNMLKLTSPIIFNVRHYAGKRPSIVKRLWDSWIPIPTGVGLTLLGVLQWRRLEKKRRCEKEEISTADSWEIEMYRKLPLRLMSRSLGHLSEFYIPEAVRGPIYSSYSNFYGVNTAEMIEPVDSYPCFGDFFARSIKLELRPVADSCIVSPADGEVLSAGIINSFELDQVKGTKYSVDRFLGESEGTKNWEEFKKHILKNPDNELYQCIIYLAPGDYHRFHSPVDWKVHFRRHFTGDLLSVNPRVAKWIPELFTLNERAVYMGSWKHGFFSMTAVGATVVGSIVVYDDKDLKTNKGRKRGRQPNETPLSLNWAKGQEIGGFRLGSTIVLIFEAPKNFKFSISPFKKVKVGKSLLTDR